MLIKETVQINNKPYYKYYSDEMFYIQRQDGIQFADALEELTSTNEYIETAIKIKALTRLIDDNIIKNINDLKQTKADNTVIKNINKNVFSDITLGDHTLDLSSYLPEDGYTWLINGALYVGIGDTSGNNRNLFIYNENKTMAFARFNIDGLVTGNGGNICVPFTTYVQAGKRKNVITISGSSDSKFKEINMYLLNAVRL